MWSMGGVQALIPFHLRHELECDPDGRARKEAVRPHHLRLLCQSGAFVGQRAACVAAQCVAGTWGLRPAAHGGARKQPHTGHLATRHWPPHKYRERYGVTWAEAARSQNVQAGVCTEACAAVVCLRICATCHRVLACHADLPSTEVQGRLER